MLVLVGFLISVCACSNQPTPPKLDYPQSIQAEAKEILLEMYIMEEAYREQYGTFWVSNEIASASNPLAFAPLGLELNSANRYSYVVISGAPSSFIALAAYGVLDDDASQDLWQIDQTGSLVVLSDDTRM